EFAVGHGVSAEEIETDGKCVAARTIWIPTAEVERVAPSRLADVELGMEALGALASADDARSKLTPLVTHYRAWIQQQESVLPLLSGTRAQTAGDMLSEARTAANRIEAGIGMLVEPDVLDAFTTSNRAMARAARQRFAIQQGIKPHEVESPAWRPFQL